MKYLSILLILILSSCASVNKMAGLGVVTESYSKFDEAREIHVSKANVQNPEDMWNFVQLEGFWTTKNPEMVVITVIKKGDYDSITGFKLKIDGVVKELEPLDAITSMNSEYVAGPTLGTSAVYSESTKRYIISFNEFKNLVHSEKAWIKVEYSKTYFEGDFHYSPTGMASAKNSFTEFLQKIES